MYLDGRIQSKEIFKEKIIGNKYTHYEDENRKSVTCSQDINNIFYSFNHIKNSCIYLKMRFLCLTIVFIGLLFSRFRSTQPLTYHKYTFYTDKYEQLDFYHKP